MAYRRFAWKYEGAEDWEKTMPEWILSKEEMEKMDEATEEGGKDVDVTC